MLGGDTLPLGPEVLTDGEPLAECEGTLPDWLCDCEKLLLGPPSECDCCDELDDDDGEELLELDEEELLELDDEPRQQHFPMISKILAMSWNVGINRQQLTVRFGTRGSWSNT